MVWKYFYSRKSAQEHGTLYQLRNLLKQSNVVTKPKRNFNSCEDFFLLIVAGHIVTASMNILNMKSKQDQPTLEAVPDLTEKWTEPKESRKLALSTVCETVVDKFVSFQFHNKPAPESDQVYAYATQIISIGCFYLELSDAIREGDGERVITCWRYLLPTFRSSGRKNYSVEALNLLYQHDFLLTPRQSAELL